MVIEPIDHSSPRSLAITYRTSVSGRVHEARAILGRRKVKINRLLFPFLERPPVAKWRISIMIHATVISPGDLGSINRPRSVVMHSINNATRTMDLKNFLVDELRPRSFPLKYGWYFRYIEYHFFLISYFRFFFLLTFSSFFKERVPTTAIALVCILT